MIKLKTLTLFSLVAVVVGCSSPSMSKVTFRSPRGSELTFEDAEGVSVGHVTFTGSLEFEQFSSSPEDDSRRAFKGTLRVNELVEEELVPSTARSLLIETKQGVDVDVKGYYRVYERETEAEAELATYAVDISKKQLLRLLEGDAVRVRLAAGESPVMDMTLGLAASE